VKILPNRTLYQQNLAQYLAYAGDFSGAERQVRTIKQPGLFGLLSLAFAQIGQGRVADADETYRSSGRTGRAGRVVYSLWPCGRGGLRRTVLGGGPTSQAGCRRRPRVQGKSTGPPTSSSRWRTRSCSEGRGPRRWPPPRRRWPTARPSRYASSPPGCSSKPARLKNPGAFPRTRVRPSAGFPGVRQDSQRSDGAQTA